MVQVVPGAAAEDPPLSSETQQWSRGHSPSPRNSPSGPASAQQWLEHTQPPQTPEHGTVSLHSLVPPPPAMRHSQPPGPALLTAAIQRSGSLQQLHGCLVGQDLNPVHCCAVLSQLVRLAPRQRHPFRRDADSAPQLPLNDSHDRAISEDKISEGVPPSSLTGNSTLPNVTTDPGDCHAGAEKSPWGGAACELREGDQAAAVLR